jgi:endonuclease-3
MSDGRIKEYLSAFKGVGPKTISCVLMFCLERREFPVDVHVWKIAVALGWVPSRANREQTYEHLNRKVPDDVKYALHVLLVQHGKVYNNEVKLLRRCVAKALKGSSKGDHL